MKIFMRLREVIIVSFIISASTFFVFYPITKGLILLPLDLLVTRYSPWTAAGTILLKNPYMQDSVTQMYPWKHMVFRSLRNGVIPFWNPYQHMGMPFLAGLKPMVLYPITWLGILGDTTGWHGLLVSQVLLSLVFSYYMARVFGLGILAAVLVAFGFSFNSLMIGVLEFGSEGHVILWLPLLFAFSKRYIDTKRVKFLGGMSLAVAASIFAGHLQYTGYMLVLVGSFVLWYGARQKISWKMHVALLGAVVGGILATAVQLGPAIELFFHSHRGLSGSSEIFTRGLIAPYKLLRLLGPDVFGNPVKGDLTIGYIETSGYFGIVALFWAVYAVWRGWKMPLVRFLTLCALTAAALSLTGIGTLLSVLHIPVITGGSGERIFVIVLFCGALLAGVGLQKFIDDKDYKGVFRLIFVYGLFVICAFGLLYLFQPILDIAGREGLIRNIRFPLIFLAAYIGIVAIGKLLLSTPIKRLVPLGIVLAALILTYADLYRMSYRFLTFSNPKFLYPETGVASFIEKQTAGTLDRVYGLSEPEISSLLKVRTIETYNPLYLVQNGMWLANLEGKQQEPLPVNKYTVTLLSRRLKETMNLLGVSYIVAGKDVNPAIAYFNGTEYERSLTRVYSDDTHAVYKNTDAHSRFGLFYKIHPVQTQKDALEILASRSSDMRSSVIVEDAENISLSEGTGAAQLVSASENTQHFRVNTDTAAILYVSDTFYRGWRAKVNNIDAHIYRANGAFRAVYVPAGDSDVTFSYYPTCFFIYGVISGVALGATLVVIIWSWIFPQKLTTTKRPRIKGRRT